MPPVEMKVHEFTRTMEQLCRKIGVTAHVTAVGPAARPARSETNLLFEAEKVHEEVKTEDGKLYEISLEIVEK